MSITVDCRGWCGAMIPKGQKWCEDCDPQRASGRPGRGTAEHEAIRQAVFARDGYRCVKCGSEEDLQAGHLVPYAAGGQFVLENLQTECGSCNRRQGARVQ